MRLARLCSPVFVVALAGLVVGCSQQGSVAPEIAVDLPGGTRMELLLIKPGKFKMGGVYPMWQVNERPPHPVVLSQHYYLGKQEVTQAQWESVMGTRPWKGEAPANPNAPATFVSWDDASAFVAKLNQAAADTPYRLPTEAEWEYACRAGTVTTWSWGANADSLASYVWYEGDSERYPGAGGAKKPNTWGLHDMCGNVAEWCADWYSSTYPRDYQEDPAGPDEGTERVVRGGDYLSGKWFVTSATRAGVNPAGKSKNVGFRVARTVVLEKGILSSLTK